LHTTICQNPSAESQSRYVWVSWASSQTSEEVADGCTRYESEGLPRYVSPQTTASVRRADIPAPWDAFELANFCKDNKVDMLVVP
jgi:hypothetical protein